MLVHASCAARQDGSGAVLLLGPPGSGKSDLLLRLLQDGWRLVGDDQVLLRAARGGVIADCPDTLRGMLEVRGLGVFGGLPAAAAPLRLAAELVGRDAVPRLPGPRSWSPGPGWPVLPAIRLHPFDGSAPARLGWALDTLCGRRQLVAGAFPAPGDLP